MHKENLKVLKYIAKHPNCEIDKNSSTYNIAMYLCRQEYVRFFEGQNNDGLLRNHIYYVVTQSGMDALAKEQWFNGKFIVLQIVLPIVIAIITTLITVCLTTML